MLNQIITVCGFGGVLAKINFEKSEETITCSECGQETSGELLEEDPASGRMVCSECLGATGTDDGLADTGDDL